MTGVAALAAAVALGACGTTATNDKTSASASTPVSSSESITATAAHNHADMMFARMMIPHHRQAIEMADIVLGREDIDPRVVEMATQIKAAQGSEIEQMQGWLKQWGMDAGDMPGMGSMPGHGGMGDMPGHGGMGNMAGMDGMLSPEEMDALKQAQGIDASKLFLTGMIKHHQGAITMGQDEIKNGQFPDAVALAKSIIESQQREIDTMNQILSSL